MTRNELTEMIRQEIRSLAFEELRNKSKEKNSEKNRIFKPKGLSEEELELALFHGGNKPEEKDITKILPVTIKEGYNNSIPQIQSSEVTEFEDSFEEMLKEVDGASVVFDKQSKATPLKCGLVKMELRQEHLALSKWEAMEKLIGHIPLKMDLQ